MDVEVIHGWPPAKVAGYIAYADRDGPFWHARGDVQAAQICQHLLAANGHPATLADCLLDWSPAPPRLLSWGEVIDQLGGGGGGDRG